MAGRVRGLSESLRAQVEQLTRELAEAREQQRATGDILRVIVSSPRNLPKVIHEIAASALRLCEATDVTIYLVEQNLLRVMARHGAHSAAYQSLHTLPIGRESPSGRAVLDRQTIHTYNAEPKPEIEFPSVRLRRRSFAPRTVLSAPLLRPGGAIGAITILREEFRPFTDQQITLLETFADQAVIAIENQWQLQDLHDRNRELKDALEQQTATGEVLRVMAGSPTDLQLALRTIAESAARACLGADADVAQVEVDALRVVARRGPNPIAPVGEAIALARGEIIGRAVLDRRTIHVPDLLVRPRDEFPETRARAAGAGGRAFLATPLLRDEQAIGAILLRRRAPGPFGEKEIKLLQTFANQAVIAIENARLFQELEDRNRELAEALEQQTATAEVLQTISRSAFDLRAVLATLIEHATRLCGAPHGAIYRLEGDLYRLAVVWNTSPRLLEFEASHPQPAGRATATGRAALERRTIQIPDVLSDPEYDWPDAQELEGYRTALSVPMLREGLPIGVITIWRNEVQPFSTRQVELVESFAAQAVIAIENARLFEQLQNRTHELAQSVEQLKGLFEVGQAVSSTLDLDTLLDTIAARAVELSGADGGAIFELDEEVRRLHLRTSHRQSAELADVLRRAPLRVGEGAAGRAVATRGPVQIPDATVEGAYQSSVRGILLRSGFRAILAVPLLRENQALGALVLNRNTPGAFAPEIVELVKTFASQSAIALQNARLFRELEEKNRALELAGRHKSQFLANMSHELRTPLNAILGYTELILDGIYGEAPAEIRDVLGRVDASGRHLLGLINAVLDLSKIEAGQLGLSLADYALAEVVQTAVASVESLAAEKGLTLEFAIPPELPTGYGDERRISQVLLNLIGNAIKFTETGGVRVTAAAADGQFVIAVSDTGPGIAPADQQRIFEEFQQLDASSTREKGGTGLGLSIARRIVDLHGGRIRVESEVEKGATFTFSLPIRIGE